MADENLKYTVHVGFVLLFCSSFSAFSYSIYLFADTILFLRCVFSVYNFRIVIGTIYMYIKNDA